MNRVKGEVGFYSNQEDPNRPGIFKQVVTKRRYTIEQLRAHQGVTNRNQMNTNITFSGQFKILADTYCNQHYYEIKYVTYGGVRWLVTGVEPKYPSLILTVEGIYGGP